MQYKFIYLSVCESILHISDCMHARCKRYLCFWWEEGYSLHWNFFKVIQGNNLYRHVSSDTGRFRAFSWSLYLLFQTAHIEVNINHRPHIDPKLSWVLRTKKKRKFYICPSQCCPSFSRCEMQPDKPQHHDKSWGNYFLILGVIDCPPDLLDWKGG